MHENFVKMIAGSLDLEEPWYIRGAEFKEEERAVHIYVGIRDTAEFVCPKCGGKVTKYGYEPKERIWRHGDCFFYPCYVHCKRPKVKCDKCGLVQINAPFERKNSRFTLFFEGYAMLLMADMPRAKVSSTLRCDEKSLASILNYWVEDAVKKTDLSNVKQLAIDETSFKRGHSYVTVVIDGTERKVIDVEQGREKTTVTNFVEKLKNKGGKVDNIQAISSDMSKSYVPAIKENFPNAKHVIDKFHVKQHFLKAVDEIRKSEQKASLYKKELFQGRKLFMIPSTKLSQEQYKSLTQLSKQYPKTGRAYRIVSSLDSFYASKSKDDAEEDLLKLFSWMRRCRLPQMKEAALLLIKYKSEILSYFDNKITNAIAEGLNSLFQAAKRKARGFNTFRGFASMIYLIAGKLNLAVPNPLELE